MTFINGYAIYRELDIEISLAHKHSEAEVMVSKPIKMGKEELAIDVALQSDEKTTNAAEHGGNENDSNKEKEALHTDIVIPAALPPPEMFEIRNSPRNGDIPNKKKEALCTDTVIPTALPPAEMFEIRNSPPLPLVGNKRLKKLMEKNKK